LNDPIGSPNTNYASVILPVFIIKIPGASEASDRRNKCYESLRLPYGHK
jgi:hypothetical protein